MSTVKNILDTFETIHLSDMDAAKLMNRTDRKFALSAAQLPLLLEKLTPHYKVLQVNDSMVSSYKTLYFDTPAMALYLKHHGGHLNRYKVRYRNYVESNTGFLEVKFKTNTGRTLKKRITSNEAPVHWNTQALDFLNKEIPYDPLTLAPSLWVNFERITLVGKELNERVTIDMNLEFLAGDLSRKLERLVIAEVKQTAKSKTPALAVLSSLHIKEESLSKYCLGVIHMYPHIKKNNFKPQLNTLNKLIYDTTFSAVAGS